MAEIHQFTDSWAWDAESSVLRHYEWIKSWVRARGAALGMSVHDIEDAQQTMASVLLEAIKRFRRRAKLLAKLGKEMSPCLS